MKELKLEELSIEQKIGMTVIGSGGIFDNVDISVELIKKHALGTFFAVPDRDGKYLADIKRVKEAADYPILITMDAEWGYGQYKIGNQMALGYIDDVEATYKYARAVGAAARADGFNAICGPILDPAGLNLTCPTRSFLLDKDGIVKHAAAYIRGLHDAGIIAITKHYPSTGSTVDTHLFEDICPYTKEELTENFIYTYIELNKMGLLDGIMTGHHTVPKIDSENPATVSKDVIDIVRNAGFDGIAITDDLDMMGICARYGDKRFAQAIYAGNDIALDWTAVRAMKSITDAYNSGELSEERINEAARRVLEAQHKTVVENPYTPTSEDALFVDDINRRSIIEICDDENVPKITRDGKHLFIMMTRVDEDFSQEKQDIADEDDTVHWLQPNALASHIKKRFPNSEVISVKEFPSKANMFNAVQTSLKYDDTVFVYFTEWLPYVGGEIFTDRAKKLAESLIISGRSSTLVYFGNPNILKDLPHFKRIIAGCNNFDNTKYCIDVLAGLIPAEGKLPYDIGL